MEDNSANTVVQNPHLLESILSYISVSEGANGCQKVCKLWSNAHTSAVVKRWTDNLKKKAIIDIPPRRLVRFRSLSHARRTLGKSSCSTFTARIVKTSCLQSQDARDVQEVENLFSDGPQLVPAESHEAVLDRLAFDRLRLWTFDKKDFLNSTVNVAGERTSGLLEKRGPGLVTGSRRVSYCSICYSPMLATWVPFPLALSSGIFSVLALKDGVSFSLREILCWAKDMMVVAQDRKEWDGLVCLSKDFLWLHNEGFTFTIEKTGVYTEIPITMSACGHTLILEICNKDWPFVFDEVESDGSWHNMGDSDMSGLDSEDMSDVGNESGVLDYH